MKRFAASFKLWPYLLVAIFGLTAGSVYADCTSPAAKEATIIYNGDYHTWQFCNGTTWIPYRWGTAWQAQSSFNPAISGGSGFFVMSKTTYTGNLGGQSGADAKCLTDLTTNTGWKGYSTANGNGQLVSSHVHAFLCYGTCWGCSCVYNNLLTPNATYYFADANSGGHGGATFTADGSGGGPNDNASWGAANYFGANYTYWTGGRGDPSNALAWTTTQAVNGQNCTQFTDGSSSNTGTYGQTSNTDAQRWFTSTPTCDNTNHLICIVDPP